MTSTAVTRVERSRAFEARFGAFVAKAAAAEREAHDLIEMERQVHGQGAPQTVALLRRLQAMRKTQVATLLAPASDVSPQVQAHLSLRAVSERVQRHPEEVLPLAWSWWDQCRRALRVSQVGTKPADEHALVRQNWQRLRHLLPQGLHLPLDMARMHYEHEVLRIAYGNDVTLASQEPVAQIPRANFFALEDGSRVYALDMDELVTVIATTFNGVFKNPYPPHALLQQSQVRAILAHPMGARLRRQQAEQAALRDGISCATAQALLRLGNILRTDVTNDPAAAVRTHEALDTFRQVMLTLPDSERHALEHLHIHAVDSHTKRTYANTVAHTLELLAGKDGETICWHKAGDYLAQAAEQLLKRFA